MRAIDADALLKKEIQERRFVFAYKDFLNDELVVRTVYKDLSEFISDAPTLTLDDLRPKGRWRGITTSYGEKAVCSECGFDMFVNEPGNGLRNIEDLSFCPSFGADMRGGGEECLD